MANCSQINNTTIKGTSAVIYDSTPLPCTDIKTCDDLNTILAKFDSVICSAVANVAILKEEVTNITEDVMIIIEDIININNQLNICCPNCNFTGTATELLVCNFTGSANEILNCSFTGTAIQPPVPTTTTTTTIAPTTTTTTTILNCDLEGNAIITVPPATTTTTTTTLPSPVAITMIVFGTGTESSACASIIANLDLRTIRYSTSSYFNAGQTMYNGPGLTNPTTGPIATYYGYIVPVIGLYAWAYVGTDGVVINSGYCS